MLQSAEVDMSLVLVKVADWIRSKGEDKDQDVER